MKTNKPEIKSPLESYAELIGQIHGKKVFPSSLRTSYPDKDTQPLQSLQNLVQGLTAAVTGSEAVAKASLDKEQTVSAPDVAINLGDDISPVAAEKLVTSESQHSLDTSTAQEPVLPAETGHHGTSSAKPRLRLHRTTLAPADSGTTGFKLADFKKTEEKSKVTSTIQAKLEQYAGLEGEEFFIDSLEKQSPDKENASSTGEEIIVKEGNEAEKREEQDVDNESLFNDALSDLSKLFDEREDE